MGADSQFLKVGPESREQKPENAQNKAKIPEKDFHQYCLISKIRSYDAAGSEVQPPDMRMSRFRVCFYIDVFI